MMGLLPDGEMATQTGVTKQSSEESGMDSREAWHTGTFWFMISGFFLLSVSFHGYIVHLVPLLTDRGASAQSAALILSLGAAGVVLGRVGAGYLLDRFFAPYVAASFFGGFALGIFLLWSGAVGGLVLVSAVLVGLGLSAEFDLMAYMVGRYFGLRAFGAIYSYAFAAFTLGAVVGPLLMGVSFDSTGSYGPALGGFVVATLMAAGLMTQLGSYRVWETDTEPAAAATS